MSNYLPYLHISVKNLCLYSNFQQCDVELKEFRIDAAFDLRTRTARNVRVNIDSYHDGATGGGFLFFEVSFLHTRYQSKTNLRQVDAQLDFSF